MIKNFTLVDSDLPYLTTLKYSSKHQYELLIYVRNHPQMPYKEIAENLNLKVGTVKTRLHRARLKILEWRTAETLKRTLGNIEAP